MGEKTIFMTREQHQKWDAALRSGKYQQGRGLLQTSDGRFCCLGVLEHCLTGEVEQLEVDDFVQLPSPEWRAAHGIRFVNKDHDNVGSPELPTLGCSAATANDHGGYTFVEIADAIAEAVEYTGS